MLHLSFPTTSYHKSSASIIILMNCLCWMVQSSISFTIFLLPFGTSCFSYTLCSVCVLLVLISVLLLIDYFGLPTVMIDLSFITSIIMSPPFSSLLLWNSIRFLSSSYRLASILLIDKFLFMLISILPYVLSINN